MEGHSDTVIPPLTAFAPGRRAFDENDSRSRKRNRCLHDERGRRETMTEMFSVLQSIVPNILHKATRESVVADTIRFIQNLEKERERLERLKKTLSPPELMMAGRPILTRCASGNRCVNVSTASSGNGGVVFFGIRSVARRNLATEVFKVFEKHGAEVLESTVTVSGGVHQRQLTVTVTAMVGCDGDRVERIKGDLVNL